MLIRKAYKIRLYPNNEQEQKMLQIIGACRFVWNYYLEQKKNYYEIHSKTLNLSKVSKDLTELRKKTEWLSKIQLLPLQQSLRRLEKSYLRFFKKKTLFPKFKSKKDIGQSFQKHQDWKIINNKIQIQKDLKIRFRGNLPEKYIKQGTLVVSYKAGRWFASIIFQEERKSPKKYSKSIGIDVGIKHLAITSEGKKYENLNVARNQQGKMRILQKKIRSTKN